MTLPPLRLEKHSNMYYYKINSEYTPTYEQKILDINPWDLGVNDFEPNEKMKHFVKRVEDKLQKHAHDVPIYANLW